MSLHSYSPLAYPLRLSISAPQLIRVSPTPQWTLRNLHADHRASSKLFADAEHEEHARANRARAAPPRNTTLFGTESEHSNWTGDESIEDAVLRMLVDKYKPLRTGTIRTAEEKMRRALAPPQVVAQQQPEIHFMSIVDNDSVESSSSQPRVYRANEPLLPAVEGHKPWLTTFKVPSHATASICYGHFSTTGSPTSSETSLRNSAQTGPADADRARRKECDVKKRSEIPGRLTRAKESSLDYRLGITKNIKSGIQARPNPVSIKGWAGLVEERIERARLEGQFCTIKGRGKPLERCNEEHNPFVAREEFLMNRIVQRQGAAPPWVETQGELEAAVATFRSVLKQSWVRRAVRMLTLSRRPLRGLSSVDIRALRDGEWEARENTYHESALAAVNALVRKYNALAPYAVRRAYYIRDVELSRAYEEGAEDIMRELDRRLSGSKAKDAGKRMVDDGDDEPTAVGVQSPGTILTLRDLFRQWFRSRRTSS